MSGKTSKMRIAAGKIISRLFLVLLAILLISNLYTIIMRHGFGQKQPEIFGFSTAVVISGSMEPAIHVDDLVLIHRQDSYQIRDIVMYEGEHSMVTHRIVGIEDGVYITQGDSNNAPDPPIPKERVAGKVIHTVHGAGKIIGFFQSPLGMCILMMAAVVILLLPEAGKKEKE